MNYNLPIKVFPDASDTVDLLSDAEAGRLFKSLLHYINGQNDELPGKEMLVYSMLKKQFDRDVASYEEYLEAQRENGKKGGRPKKTMGFSENPNNPRVFNSPKKTLEVEVEVDHEHDHDQEQEAEVEVDRARELSTAAADRVVTFACNELQYMSPRALEELQSYRADGLTDDVILYGLGAACDSGVRTWAYARSILNRYVQAGYKTVGDIKAAEAKREAAKANMVSDGHGGKVANPALQYDQRSGDDFNAEITDDWVRDYLPAKEGV